jgi:gliding motility-associated-like protein
MRIFLLLLSLFWAAGLSGQTLNVTNVVRTGLLSTCSNSVPIVTASFSSGSGTSVTNGNLVCTDPCGTTTLLVSISNLKWEQQNAEWIHSVFFPANAGFTVSGISLPPGFITYNAGCTGLCPVGITAGPGFYYDASAGNSCCPGATANDGNPCNNWGASTLNCSNAFSISFYMTFCNSTLTTTTETFTLTAQSDGGTGCYDVNNFTSHTVSFNINVVPCGPVVVPSASAPVRSCTGGSLNYTSTLTGPCNNNGTVTWWTAATGGTQVGSGSPFIYDPAGSTCPGGQTLYASCCPAGSTTCLPRTAVTIPGTCTVPSITTVNTAAGSCAAGASITSVSTANTVNPLTYTLQPSGASNSTGVFTNLTQTAYTLTVSDAGSCTATSVVSLSPAPLTTFNTPVINAVSCSGGNDGSLSISANGVAPITYGIIPAATQTLAGNFTGLIAQVYTVTATDGNNCTASTTVTISQPASLQVNLSAPPIPCLGATTTLSASVSGGTLNYQFQLNGGPLQGNNSYSVSAGTYTVSVTDGNNCTASSVLNITSPTAVGISTSFTPVSCFGGQSTLTVNGSGGTSPYFYGINNGPLQSGNTFSLGAGSYTVTVSDVNNCSTNSVVTITEPPAINLSLSSGTILCNNGTTNISATGGGGSPAYQYQLNNGPLQGSNVFTVGAGTYTVTVSDLYACSNSSVITISQPPILTISSVFNPIPCYAGSTLLTLSAIGGTGVIQYSLNNSAYQSGNTYNIVAGSYTITAKDANNCTASTTILVTEPPVLSVTASSTAILCQGGTSQITASGTGGTGAYQYQLNSGGYQSSNTFNVVAGTYTITIQDANNCTSSTVTTITEPTLLGLNLSSTTILCNGGQSTITATANGGTTAYQYSLNGAAYQSGNTFTVGVGTYTISTQDANGCTASSVINIIQPTLLQITNLSSTIPTCVPGNDAVLTITASGGTTTYQYSLNGGAQQSSNIFSGLGAGTYTVTVTDLNGCTSQSSIQIITPNAPTMNAPAIVSVLCHGQNNGSISITASGGTGQLTYGILPGGTTNTSGQFNNLISGTYTLSATDASGCSVSSIVVVTEPPVLSVTASSTAILCQGGTSQITASGTGGTGAYQYQLNNGGYQSSNTFNVVAGTYTITIQDANNCTSSTVTTITEPTLLGLNLSSTAILCNGGQSTITATANGGTTAYQYSLNGAAYQSGNTFTVGVGTYTISTQDANGCTASSVINIIQPTLLQITNLSSTIPTCVPGNDAVLTVTASGGTTTYQYSLNGGTQQSSNIFSGLGAGTYTVTVTDLNGCTSQSSIQIITPNAPTMNAPAIVSVLCHGQNNGSISITASGGTGQLTYGILPGGTTNTSGQFNNLIAGTYTLSATDASGCSVSSIVVVTEPPVLSVTASSTVILCQGGTSQITASGTGGTGAYQYQLNNGGYQSNNTFNVVAGTYTITIQDANNCTSSIVTTITEPTLLGLNLSATAILCNGGQSTITATANGGTTAYQYSLNGAAYQSGNTFTVGVGTYTISTQDANGCTASSVINIIQPTLLQITNLNSTIPTCVPGNDAVLTITASGGTTTYQYSLNGGTQQSSNIFSGLGAGTYTVTVTDLNGCTSQSSIQIITPNAPTMNAPAIVSVLCHGQNNGSISITASGGTGQLTYGILPGGTTNTSGQFNNLIAGTYTLSATDASGCSVSSIVVVTEPPVLSVTASSTVILCQGGTSQITASGTGGTGAYQYQLNNGGYQSSNTFNVVAGTYTITIQDANNCTSSTITTITEPTLLGLNLSSTAILCNGGQSTITATANGGTTAYQYSLNGAAYQSGNTFTVGVGTYTISTQDANGCTASSVINITQPTPLQITNLSSTIPTCVPGNDAVLTVTASGGTTTYQYSLNGGTQQSSNIFSGLGAGTYTVTVTDLNGCTSQSSIQIITPNAPTMNAPAIVSVLCHGQNNGSISITASGGTGQLTYGILPGGTTNTIGQFNNLIAGTYTLSATDASGCSVSSIVVVTEPPVLSVTASSTVILCQGGTSQITASGTGGTGAYQYQLNNGGYQSSNTFNVVAGTYTITIQDANNCTSSTITTITEPTLLGLNLSSTAILCNGGQSTITATANGGTTAYQYSLNGAAYQSGNTFTVGVGTYTISTQDANGCTASSVINIIQPTLLQITNLSSTIPTCVPGNDAVLTITASGGTTTYQYSLNGGTQQSSNIFSGLGAGTYTVTVTDLNDCTSQSSIQIITPNAPTMNAPAIVSVLCHGQNNGSISITASGGTGQLTYGILPGGTTNTSGQFNNLIAGTYTLSATDVSGCSVSSIVVVTEPPVLSVTASSTAILCQGGTSQITASGTGGTGAYQYQLNSGGYQSSNTFNVVAGTYTITMQDANNCTSSTVTTITEPTLLGLNLSSTAILCNGGQSTITATANGGTTAYQYSLNGAAYQSGNTFTVGVGTYTISTQDANGCTSSSTIILTEPSILNASILTWVDPTCTNPGTATATANGGVTPYIFTWNTLPVQNNALATGLSAGTYIVTVTDLNGCTDTSSVTLTNPNTPIINSVNTTNATCVPGCDGSMQVLASGGNSPFNYSFDNGSTYQAGNSLNGLCIGTYTVVVKDANDCTVSTLVNIQNPNAPVINLVTNTNASCVPGCDANSIVAVTGGTPAYQYSSDNGVSYQLSNQFQSLCTGSFTIVVKDAAGCSVSTVSTINTSNGPQIDSVQWINPLCFGDCNGQITTFTSNGTQPIVYAITPNTPNQIAVGQFGNVCAGTYTILATDANGCTYSTILTLTEPSVLQNNLISTQNVSVFGQSNGSAITSATGGTPGYTYSINPNIGVQSTPGTFTGLSSGNYTVTVIDTNGCSDQVVFTITEPAQIFVNVINVNPNPCFGDSLASITASAIGGVPPYIYTINPLLGIQNPNGVFSNLPAGIYTIQVQDLNGAVNDTSIQIVDPAKLIITNLISSDESCVPAADGSIVINATGGSGQLGYTLIPNGLSNLTGIFNGLVSATYSLQVSDQNNCKVDTVATVDHVPLPSLSTSITNPLCFGSSDGQIQTSASSGTPPYIIYAITPIAGTQGPAATFTGLAAQTYTLSVTDSEGCVGLDTVQLVNPPLLILDSVSQQNVSCFGLNDASIQAYHSGGTGVIQFLIQPTGVNNTTGYFNGLSVGNYTITATDQQGCNTVTQVLITQPNPLVGASPQLTMVTCNGGNDGAVSVNANGGTGPYTFTIVPGGTSNNNGQFNNLQAGTYSVLITDANNCTDIIANLIITQPAAINYSNVSIQDIACFGDFSGAITVTAIGGTGNLVFSILPASGLQQTSGVFSNLAAGVYTIIATDQSGCATSTIAQIKQNPDIQIDLLTFGEPTCYGDGDGYLLVNAIGGVNPLTYQLNGNSPFVVGQFNNLIAGNYLLSIVDALGCRLDTTLILTQPDSVYYSKLEVNGVLCPGASNGKVVVVGQGGRGDYTYYLKPGLHFNKSGYFEGLHEGNYVLIIKDSAGCQFDTTIFISPSNAINSNIIKQDLKCFGTGFEAWAEVQMQGGESPFTYAWSTEPVQTTARVEGLTFGYYFVEIVDANGCEIKDTVYINPGPCCEEVFIPNAFSPNGDGVNDLFRVTTSAGIELIQFAVYNRWGNRVWSTNDFRSGWDGTYQGKDEDMNTYFYIFKYTCLTDQQQYTKKGDLLLMR